MDRHGTEVHGRGACSSQELGAKEHHARHGYIDGSEVPRRADDESTPSANATKRSSVASSRSGADASTSKCPASRSARSASAALARTKQSGPITLHLSRRRRARADRAGSRASRAGGPGSHVLEHRPQLRGGPVARGVLRVHQEVKRVREEALVGRPRVDLLREQQAVQRERAVEGRDELKGRPPRACGG